MQGNTADYGGRSDGNKIAIGLRGDGLFALSHPENHHQRRESAVHEEPCPIRNLHGARIHSRFEYPLRSKNGFS